MARNVESYAFETWLMGWVYCTGMPVAFAMSMAGCNGRYNWVICVVVVLALVSGLVTWYMYPPKDVAVARGSTMNPKRTRESAQHLNDCMGVLEEMLDKASIERAAERKSETVDYEDVHYVMMLIRDAIEGDELDA